eukprot:14856104-Ditylum_brightwellii.AAC.1
MEGALSQMKASHQFRVEELIKKGDQLREQNSILQRQNKELSEEIRGFMENRQNIGELSRQQAEHHE